jgi:hypothetical protein
MAEKQRVNDDQVLGTMLRNDFWEDDLTVEKLRFPTPKSSRFQCLTVKLTLQELRGTVRTTPRNSAKPSEPLPGKSEKERKK